MGVIQIYYSMAYAENERMKKEAEADAKRREAERNDKANGGRQRRPHPVQGGISRLSTNTLSELAEEFDEEGGL